MFKTPLAQWENILKKPLKNQVRFLKKICKVNRRDELIIRSAFFDNLSFDMIRKIFPIVRDVIDTDAIDYSFEDIILDRLLRVSEIAHLYPEDRNAKDNLIHGEGYHVYSANYNDLDLIIDFINSNEEINSICDMGSGSGRAIFYMALGVKRNIEFVGLELVDDRVEFTRSIASHFELKNVLFKTSNFLKTPEDLSGFDTYYLYDPVGTDDVDNLIKIFEKMINDGHKFHILFISGWDDLFLNALEKVKGIERIETNSSHKQAERYVNFYKVSN